MHCDRGDFPARYATGASPPLTITSHVFLVRACGHSVTVLYLKGQICENETVDHWIEFYGRLGVRFVPLPTGTFELICSSPRWQRQMYQLHAWLKDEAP